MATLKLSILTFPQKFEGGKLHFNILVIPRNLNPLEPIDPMQPAFPAFADAAPAFKAMVINNLDGLPLTGNVTNPITATLINPITSSRRVWEALKVQVQTTDGLTIDDGETNNADGKFEATKTRYKNVAIRKYLPETYRAAFNFTRAKTKYAVVDDAYHCSIKNSGAPTDTPTNRDKISWGKAIAMCLRNPLLAEKAGLIYKAEIDVTEGLFDAGGWLYIDFDNGSPYETFDKTLIKQYAARIPALKNLTERVLFAPVQFPVSTVAVNNAGYDEIMREAIVYDDGFAKIVHANQPINDYLLEETDKSNPPQKDIGIRLGWDDEQLTIWQNRQMLQKEETTGNDVDAPLGVFSYCIDAKKEADTSWFSQNSVVANNGLTIQGGLEIAAAGTQVEMGSEVHPAAHGSSATEGFWLPMYFTNWMGKSLAIPDKDAADIHQTNAAGIQPTQSRYTDPEYYKKAYPAMPDAQIAAAISHYKNTNTLQTIPKQTFNPFVQTPEQFLPLEYGNTYNFRIRLMDLTGGTPGNTKDPIHGAPRPVESWHFKRHTAASAVVISNIDDTLNKQPEITDLTPLKDTSILENIVEEAAPTLTIQRPKLAYPAVVFTGKYKAPDAVTRLKAILENAPADPNKVLSIGLADPDVNSFKVLVEIQSLIMDNALSLSGKESYVKLYEKTYAFDANVDADFALNIVYEDYQKLPFDESFNDTGAANELKLPTARNLRLTFTSIVSDADNIYADDSVEFGKTIVLSSYKIAHGEVNLITTVEDGVKAMYLQPDSDGHNKPAVSLSNLNTVFIYPQKQLVKSSTPAELERIADVLNIQAHNLTLEGIKGERVQFGCTKQMRHSLAPDSSSVTFSSLKEIFNHWVIAVNYTLQRDWSWDGLKVNSFLVYRQVRLETGAFGDEERVGTINVSRTANINALTNAQRDYTNLIFLDTLDPKDYNGIYPKEMFVKYRLEPHTKSELGIRPVAPAFVHLPVTIVPHQIPKLVSAGVALSAYESDEKYTLSNTRQKFLWFEMDEPPLDENDTYYVRVLANAPDPMLCLVDEAIMFNVPAEPPLNINDEKIRTIIQGMDNDYAGIGAMQEMVAENTAKPRYFMVPLPQGLHAESDELFGFFSCEIRVGHKKELWSTAQGRYGRPLKVNGVQHPAPALICNAFRRKYKNAYTSVLVNEIAITAPYANAVLNGKNVAALPPQTSLWCFLYAQVKQADGKAYRNILLASKPLLYKRSKLQVDDGNRYGICSFSQPEISAVLRAIGLPVSSSLSVLTVEMFPLSNRWRSSISIRSDEQVPGILGGTVNYLRMQNTEQHLELLDATDATNTSGVNIQNPSTGEGMEAYAAATTNQIANPLIEGLGKYRIYRTSALVPVENICCEDC